MMVMNHPHPSQEKPLSFWRSLHAIGYLAIGAVAGYYLLTEHLAHVLGVLPYLLVFACPLMHVFMHGGHGHHHQGHTPARAPTEAPDKSKRETP